MIVTSSLQYQIQEISKDKHLFKLFRGGAGGLQDGLTDRIKKGQKEKFGTLK